MGSDILKDKNMKTIGTYSYEHLSNISKVVEKYDCIYMEVDDNAFHSDNSYESVDSEKTDAFKKGIILKSDCFSDLNDFWNEFYLVVFGIKKLQ